MSFSISPVGKEYETPFAILTPSASNVLFFNQSSPCSGVIKASPLSLKSESYCEAAYVHANYQSSGFFGYTETSHNVDYMRGSVINKSSTAGIGAWNAPKGDDLALSFGNSHAWAISGSVSFSPTTSDTAKSHALLIMLR